MCSTKCACENTATERAAWEEERKLWISDWSFPGKISLLGHGCFAGLKGTDKYLGGFLGLGLKVSLQHDLCFVHLFGNLQPETVLRNVPVWGFPFGEDTVCAGCALRDDQRSDLDFRGRGCCMKQIQTWDFSLLTRTRQCLAWRQVSRLLSVSA